MDDPGHPGMWYTLHTVQTSKNAADLLAGRNIPLNYAFSALMSFRLDWAVWMLFLSYRGLGLFEIGLIESVSQLASLVCGVPAGVISDVLGRRASAVLSVLMRVAAFSVMLVARDFPGFALAFALNAMSQVLYNATYESITYDTCKITGREGDYRKVLGNLIFIVFVVSSVGVAAGGFVAEFSFEYVYLITLAAVVVALVPALLFRETTTALRTRHERRGSLAGHFKKAAAVLRDNPFVAYMMLLSITIVVVDSTINIYLQKYFVDMALPLFLVGIIFSAVQLCVALGAKLSFLLDRFPVKTVIAGVPLAMLLSYALLMLTNNVLAAVLVLFVALVTSMFYPLQSQIVNSRLPAESRATLLSFKGQLASLSIMVVFPLVGLLAERTSLSTALLCFVACASPITIYLLAKINRARNSGLSTL